MYFRAKLSISSDKVKYVQLTVPEELREEKLEYTGAATIVGKKIIIKNIYICITALYPLSASYHFPISISENKMELQSVIGGAT